MTSIVIVTAGLSDPSTSRMLADRYVDALGVRLPAASVEVVGLREFAHDITDATLSGFASPRLQHVLDQVQAADALVAITPVFQASYSGLFKSFFDVFEADALAGKPVLLGATGGTARHSLVIEYALRPLFAYLQAFALPTGVFAAPHDWGSAGTQALATRVDRAVAELASVLDGAGTGRGPADEFDLLGDAFLAASRP